MVYRPLDEKIYLKFLKVIGWSLVKGSIDYKLLDENDTFICAIKISHGKKSKQEVVARSVHRTEQECKKRGVVWPPKKK